MEPEDFDDYQTDRRRGWAGWGLRAERKARTKGKARVAAREDARRLAAAYNGHATERPSA